ncbi:MAG TPA: peptide chain release factor N(5)-glutamine methyltransferase [Cytophagaceae bacterium]|jgi:release factor glutamine methyltransferase
MSTSSTELRQLWKSFSSKIEPYSRDESENIVFLMLERHFNIQKMDLIISKKIDVSKEDLSLLGNYIRRVNNFEPVQYILEEATFYGRKYKVNPSVLIPRPETEELVDLIKKKYISKDIQTILDLGTGSGCIAITLAAELKAQVTAIDISKESLAVATKNAELNKIKVKFQQADILKLKSSSGLSNFDIVVSNPPYVCVSEKRYMGRNVLDYEPHTALFVPDEDPLKFYKAIIERCSFLLKSGGACYFEINERFALPLFELFSLASFQNINIVNDLQGKPRIAYATKP